MDPKIPISVVIITQNEELSIRAALESIKDFEDIVIVDAFSTDKTIEISRQFGVRIFQHEWQGFARQKQIAINYARKEWVLILDADERMTQELKLEISNKLSTCQVSGFYIPRKNFFLGKWIRHSGWWPDYVLRLFRKNLSEMEPREVHEKMIVKGPVAYLKNPIEHWTVRTISQYTEKQEKYSTLAAKEIVKKKRNAVGIHLLFNPLLTFIKMFFIRQGFRDGFLGFVLAVLSSYQTFLKYLKAWELKRKLVD